MKRKIARTWKKLHIRRVEAPWYHYQLTRQGFNRGFVLYMAQDIRKLKDTAQALFLKGKYVKALEIYQDIVKLEPKEVKNWVKIGDLYKKLERKEQAIEIYAKAARAFAVGGFLMQAISVSKMILEIDPAHKDTQSSLAELYAKKEGGVAATQAAPKPASAAPGAAAEPAPRIAPGVSAASMAVLESLKKKKPAAEAAPAPTPAPAAKPAAAAPAQAPKPAPAPAPAPIEIPDLSPEPAVFDEEVIVEEAQLDVDEALIAEAEAEPDRSVAGAPKFDSLDLDLADDLFNNIISQEEVSLDDGGRHAASMELPHIPLFSSLTPDEFTGILQRLELRRFDVRDRIVREGERGDSFYIVARGAASVIKKDPQGREIVVGKLTEGQFFGEFAFFNDSERGASVIVTQEMEALEMSRAELEALTRQYPRIQEVLKQFYRERMLSTLLAISPLFGPFNMEERNELIKLFELVNYDAGSIVIKQGVQGEGLYLVLSGEIVVNVKAADGTSHEVARLNEGSFFGEISLINDSPTTANCLAAEDCEIFKLPRATFKELVMVQPRILDVVAEFGEKRSQQTRKIVVSGKDALASAGMV